MEWTDDVTAGDWLRDRMDAALSASMHGFVPHGFAGYARVFHPVWRERPVGRTWPREDDRAGWEEFSAARPEIDGERVTWAQTAAAFGTVMHPLAQWFRLVKGSDPYGNDGSARDGDGWRYDAPREGELEPDSLAALATVLSDHTTTPDAGHIAVWEGWGDLVGGLRPGPSRTFLSMRYSDDPDVTPDDAAEPGVDYTSLQHARLLAQSGHDTFNNPFARETWHPGRLSDEISHGPRLRLPGRDHVLFRGGVHELAHADWALAAPWRDREAEQHGFAPHAESPSLVWPDDHAWVMVSEIDMDSTVVAGSSALMRALMAAPGLEVALLREGADLTWDGDDRNR